MIDFDETTERDGEIAAKDYAAEMRVFPSGLTLAAVNGHTRGWDAGRGSVRESMMDLAGVAALAEVIANGGPIAGWRVVDLCNLAQHVVSKVKERGDWPLEEKVEK